MTNEQVTIDQITGDMYGCDYDNKIFITMDERSNGLACKL